MNHSSSTPCGQDKTSRNPLTRNYAIEWHGIWLNRFDLHRAKWTSFVVWHFIEFSHSKSNNQQDKAVQNFCQNITFGTSVAHSLDLDLACLIVPVDLTADRCETRASIVVADGSFVLVDGLFKSVTSRRKIPQETTQNGGQRVKLRRCNIYV